MQVQVEFYWPPNLTKSEKLQIKCDNYVRDNPDSSFAEHLLYILRNLKNKEFCIVEPHSNVWHYLQFTREQGMLCMSYPWSVKFGRRFRQYETIRLMLQAFGYSRREYWEVIGQGIKSFVFYDDTIGESAPQLNICFGSKGEWEALKIFAEITIHIFHVPENTGYHITMGSWR